MSRSDCDTVTGLVKGRRFPLFHDSMVQRGDFILARQFDLAARSKDVVVHSCQGMMLRHHAAQRRHLLQAGSIPWVRLGFYRAAMLRFCGEWVLLVGGSTGLLGGLCRKGWCFY